MDDIDGAMFTDWFNRLSANPDWSGPKGLVDDIDMANAFNGFKSYFLRTLKDQKERDLRLFAEIHGLQGLPERYQEHYRESIFPVLDELREDVEKLQALLHELIRRVEILESAKQTATT